MLAACVAQSADPEAPGASAQAVTVSSPVPPTTDPLAGAPSTFELLVVTDQGYAPQAKPLIDYKNANGTSAFLVTMQGVVQGTSCQLGACDDAVRLKLLIQRAYETHGTRYVMLLGDVGVVPTRPVAGIATPQVPLPATTEFSVFYQTTDHYYANLYSNHNPSNPASHGGFSDWRDPQTGYYDTGYGVGDNVQNNPSQVDGYPDLAVGRVPARNPSDVTTYVNKIIAYESGLLTPATSLPYAWVADVGYGGSDSDIRSIVTSSGLPATQQTYVQINDFTSSYASPFQGAQPEGSNNLIDLFGNALWINYVGHGSTDGLDGWGWSGGSPSFQQLSNPKSVPIVFAAACQSAQFAPYIALGFTQPYLDTNNRLHDYQLNDTAGVAVDSAQNGAVIAYPVPTAPMGIYQKGHTVQSLAGDSLFYTGGQSYGGAIAWIGDTIVDQDNHPVTLAGYMEQQCAPRLGDAFLNGQRGYWSANQNAVDWFSAPRLFLTVEALIGDPSLRLVACQRAEPFPSGLSWAAPAGVNTTPKDALLGARSPGVADQYVCKTTNGMLGHYVQGLGCFTNDSAAWSSSYSVLVDGRAPGSNPTGWMSHTGDVCPANAFMADATHGICRGNFNGVENVGAFSADQVSVCRSGGATTSTFEMLVYQSAHRGPDDLVWRDSQTNQIGLWQISSSGSIRNYIYPAPVYPAAPTPPASTAKYVGSGDFDGDGHADLLFYDPSTAASQVWLLNGTSTYLRTAPFLTGMVSTLAARAVGDFDGDGLADVLLVDSSTNALSVALGDGRGGARATNFVQALAPEWSVSGIGDFNADGTTDVLLRSSLTGTVIVIAMGGGAAIHQTTLGTNVAANWSIQGTGDFNGDGVSDVLWRDSSTGDVGAWLLSSSVSIQSYVYPQRGVTSNWSIQTTGDFNGDGVTDVAWRDSSTGNIALWLMSRTGSIQQYAYPAEGVSSAWQIAGSASDLVPGN